jgi:hypothetical protein
MEEAKMAVVWDMDSLIQVPLIIPILLEAKMAFYHYASRFRLLSLILGIM